MMSGATALIMMGTRSYDAAPLRQRKCRDEKFGKVTRCGTIQCLSPKEDGISPYVGLCQASNAPAWVLIAQRSQLESR